MRIAITGARGQLGQSLLRALEGDELLPLNRPEYDITATSVVGQIAALEPELVIHCAAMTDVDGCELNPAAAYRVNALGTQNVALACQRCGAALVYISTDYIFDGQKREPYLEFDLPNPLSIYGASKLAGERYVKMLLSRFYIVRTSWLYAKSGRNFVSRVLELAEARPELRMVTNEVSSPTYAPDLAQALAQLIRHPHYGLYHLSNEGQASRYDWAKEILRLAGQPDYPLHPAESYPRPARVPAFSVLRNFCAAESLGIRLRPWPEALRDYFRDG